MPGCHFGHDLTLLCMHNAGWLLLQQGHPGELSYEQTSRFLKQWAALQVGNWPSRMLRCFPSTQLGVLASLCRCQTLARHAFTLFSCTDTAGWQGGRVP